MALRYAVSAHPTTSAPEVWAHPRQHLRRELRGIAAVLNPALQRYPRGTQAVLTGYSGGTAAVLTQVLRRYSQGYSAGTAGVPRVYLVAQAGKASGSVPDLFGRTKINPAWAD